MEKTLTCEKCDGLGSVGNDVSLNTCDNCFGIGCVPEGMSSEFKKDVELDNSARKKLNHILNKPVVDANEEESSDLTAILDQLLDDLKITDYKDRLFAHDMFFRGFSLGVDAEILEE